jgi:hypothetical protein
MGFVTVQERRREGQVNLPNGGSGRVAGLAPVARTEGRPLGAPEFKAYRGQKCSPYG